MERWIWQPDGMYPDMRGYFYDVTEVEARFSEMVACLRSARPAIASYYGEGAITEHVDKLIAANGL